MLKYGPQNVAIVGDKTKVRMVEIIAESRYK